VSLLRAGFFVFSLAVLAFVLPLFGCMTGLKHYQAADEARTRGEYDTAIEQYTAAIEAGDLSKQQLAEAYHHRGGIYADKKDYDRAIGDYNEAIRLNPGYGDVYNDRGTIYRVKNDVDRAIEDFNEAIRLNPNDDYAYSNRGVAYDYRREYDRAIEDFNEALRINPTLAPVYNNRGGAYHQKKDYDRAIADFNEAIRLAPKLMQAYYGRGLSYAKKKDYDHAIEDFDKAIYLNPTYILAYYGRADAYRDKNDYEHAIENYSEVVRMYPYGTGPYASRGLVRFYRAEFLAAADDFSKAIELKIAWPHSPIWLYIARTRGGKDGRAELRKNAAKLKVGNITEKLVELFLDETSPDEVFRAAENSDAAKRKETLCEAQFYLGEHALLQGKKQEALKLFKAALEICPTDFVEYSGAKAELGWLEK
jgi:tetratricopeptide (TPR) repeat protein